VVDVGPEPDGALLIEDVGHVSIDEVGMVSAFCLRVEEGFLLFGDDADLSVVVEHVEVGGPFQGAELHVEDAFELVVPEWGGRYQ
jgi:hypothetical protein